MQKRSSELPIRKINKNKNFNLSVEYGKTDMNIVEDDRIRQAQTQANFMPQPPPSYPKQSPSMSSMGSRGRVERKLVEDLNQEKEMLEQELSEKESEIYKLQSSLKSNIRNLKGMFKQSL